MSSTLSHRSGKYWDENKEKSLDPAFWMAHPLCRRAINRRVSGSPDEWPLDWFRRLHVSRPFGRGVSWGCGLGAFERSAMRKALAALQASHEQLKAAQLQLIQAEKMESIHYSPGDFDDPRLARRRYDVVFFHASLHHVSQLERLFLRLAHALKPGGAIYLDEYIGPSRDRWDGHRLRVARALLDLLPPEARLQQELQPPIEPNDPSEAVRSEEIPLFFHRYFETVAWRPYGGQLVDLLFPCLRPEWTRSEQGERTIRAWLEIEEREIASDFSLSHHVVAYGRLKTAGLFRRILAG